MTELFSREIRTQNRRSSKGNQLKFERDHIWYKADYQYLFSPASVSSGF